ncbi:MAG: aldo/keto reductase [Microcystis viridis Mv_BB_P_19951000_S69]|uniref:Aldo/keto reductase n=1 Tax=Microcystis viridis Mv_BB_P_19951000_S68D TaxID=2486270 RepID=A0A552HP85_MICVR|nr:aldo/keto reductase [Microcystis aeruginosa]TRU73030.1 MAG: aldo/keto reductase [Microcystis viridis Mv_BB_P_19951000_S68D]TRU76473.1 MAG: aldo/keto reductase [Microcystis viridis Mv_BB_P_19951000_S68]TRU78122.1 MAG: aldo/keto reductase [Microcystis viridis Mv_BB_P_19951000_S69]TRU89195.1 MAG: aldo/keto reductase [Microcystis viridis Mv_BB_P_19951000_S69D]MDB9422614.1 aldo/keto reductase [Microcystis aeruginosa CS-563/04]
MSESPRLQFTPDLEICRILNGMWQVSGAHGSIAPQKAISSMFSYLDAGFTTWDLADHYGPAEDFIGEFRRQLVAQRGIDALNNLQAFTKWVPRPGKMTKEIVAKNIAISLRRMDVDSLDLLQFHWWDYRDKNYLDALYFLGELQQEGKIKHLALTNFDTEHLKIILSAGIKIVSNQVQFSLIDRRPLVKMAQFCQEHNIYLLAYGTLAGGLLGAKYLGHPQPNAMSLNTASLRKYKNMINAWGNWQLFQELLTVLKAIADSYHVTIPNVAVRYVLEQKAVAGAIIGVRLGVAEHIAENARIFDFQLSPQDYQKIDHVLQKSRDLLQLIGDCGDEYRR